MSNIAEAFVAYLTTQGVGIFGQDIFIGQAPSSTKSQNNIWWLVASGGSPISKNKTNESIVQYSINLFCRGVGYKAVQDSLYDIVDKVSCSGCVQLQGFEIVDITVNQFPIDQDLDSEDRKIGLLQINIKVYLACG